MATTIVSQPVCPAVPSAVSSSVESLRPHASVYDIVTERMLAELPLANKKRICYLAVMPVRSCRLTIQDLDGVSHTVHVTAATLYEAVARAALHCSWQPIPLSKARRDKLVSSG